MQPFPLIPILRPLVLIAALALLGLLVWAAYALLRAIGEAAKRGDARSRIGLGLGIAAVLAAALVTGAVVRARLARPLPGWAELEVLDLTTPPASAQGGLQGLYTFRVRVGPGSNLQDTLLLDGSPVSAGAHGNAASWIGRLFPELEVSESTESGGIDAGDPPLRVEAGRTYRMTPGTPLVVREGKDAKGKQWRWFYEVQSIDRR